MQQYAVIDEIEEDICVLIFDDGYKLHMNRKRLPSGVREGSVLRITIEIDAEEEAKRVKEITDIQQRLLKRTRDNKN